VASNIAVPSAVGLIFVLRLVRLASKPPIYWGHSNFDINSGHCRSHNPPHESGGWDLLLAFSAVRGTKMLRLRPWLAAGLELLPPPTTPIVAAPD
jgi:hypothetical protein